MTENIMDNKVVEGVLPLYLVPQQTKLSDTSGTTTTPTQPEISDGSSIQKQNVLEVPGPPEYQYHTSTTLSADVQSQVYSTANMLVPPVLLSPIPCVQSQDKDSMMGLTPAVMDKLRAVLLTASHTASMLPLYTLPSCQSQTPVPLYTTPSHSIPPTSHTPTSASEVTQAITDITYQSCLQSSLPALQVSNSCPSTPLVRVTGSYPSIAIMGTETSGVTTHSKDVELANNIIQLTNSTSTMSAASSGKSISSEHLPIVELLMETPADGKEDDNYQVIEVLPIPVSQYCMECNKSYAEICPEHDTNYHHIPDMKIESRARSTLPTMLSLMLVPTQTNFNNIGVFCNSDLPEKTLFGPLEGRVVSRDNTTNLSDHKNNMWQLFQNGSPSLLLDCSDENNSNWLMFMSRAEDNSQQNVVVYQQALALYFIIIKPVLKNQQLLYWYSDEYAQLLGLPKRPDLLLYCNICREQFISEDAVEGHKKKLHPNPTVKRKFCCPLCQKAFTSRYKVDVHMAKHTKIKPYPCIQCGKAFTDQSNLKKHMKIHNDEKNFHCFYCGKRFRQKSHLDGHIVIHTGVKRLSCRYCDKKFSRANDLKQHQYIHTNERNLSCDVCSKVFHRQQNLMKHRKIHMTDRERFPCVQCNKDFPDKYHRNRHSASCKGIKPPKQIRSETGAELGLSIAKKRIQKRDIQQKQLKEGSDVT